MSTLRQWADELLGLFVEDCSAPSQRLAPRHAEIGFQQPAVRRFSLTFDDGLQLVS